MNLFTRVCTRRTPARCLSPYWLRLYFNSFPIVLFFASPRLKQCNRMNRTQRTVIDPTTSNAKIYNNHPAGLLETVPARQMVCSSFQSVICFLLTNHFFFDVVYYSLRKKTLLWITKSTFPRDRCVMATDWLVSFDYTASPCHLYLSLCVFSWIFLAHLCRRNYLLFF